jgi:hypothetical protein
MSLKMSVRVSHPTSVRAEPVEARLPALDLSLQFGAAVPHSHKKLLGKARVTRWMRMALLRPAEITVRIVGSAEGRVLNREYRHKGYATNVLTFDYTRAPGAVRARSGKRSEGAEQVRRGTLRPPARARHPACTGLRARDQ